MKTVRTVAVLLLLASSLLPLAACNDFERNAYRTLKVAQVEYELLQDHAARAYVQGRLTDDQWNRFAVAGHRFIAAHTLAADLMKTYQQARRAGATAEETQRLQAQINAALAHLPALLVDLRNLLASFDTPAPPASAFVIPLVPSLARRDEGTEGSAFSEARCPLHELGKNLERSPAWRAPWVHALVCHPERSPDAGRGGVEGPAFHWCCTQEAPMAVTKTRPRSGGSTLQG